MALQYAWAEKRCSSLSRCNLAPVSKAEKFLKQTNQNYENKTGKIYHSLLSGRCVSAIPLDSIHRYALIVFLLDFQWIRMYKSYKCIFYTVPIRNILNRRRTEHIFDGHHVSLIMCYLFF